ncbi:MAG: hypothetical protein OSJ52_01990 [Lachnospiraceae bacterium]|nr:hypothetical protein [Lachnospiraceae bacterium]
MNNKTNRSVPSWWTLDNAAKIFPSTGSSHDSKVFRFVCELQETVNPQILQTALDKTIERFPMYRSVMKRGWFWYYLEDSALPAQVRSEKLPPCYPIYPSVRRSLLFRVLYYRKRISLEVYHSLTDGTGALNFLCTLVYEYLLLRYPDMFPKPFPELPYDASQSQRQTDSFQKYYEKPTRRLPKYSPAAYQLRGERLPRKHLAILEGRMPLEQVLSYARSKGVTLTELMAAVFLRAIHEGMRIRDRKKPVVITIPVNLRNYFPSESARNFFATINVSYDFGKGEASLDAVLAEVKRCFQSSLTEERMREHMNTLCALEHSIPLRLVPLPIKDIVLRIANRLTSRGITASFSNVGKVSMPKEMQRLIRLFSVFTSAGMLQACACSFGGQYVISFASPFCSYETERVFFRELAQMGIEVVLTTNLSLESEVNE